MHLLSNKIKFKNIFFALVILLVLLCFRNAIFHLLIFFSRQLIFSPQKLSQEIEELKKENLLLSLQVKNYRGLREENEKLQKAFSFKKEKEISLVGAEVIGFAPSNWSRFVIINVGQDKGLKKGLFVINEKGNLVGRITETDKDFSRLTLVNDPNFNAPVVIGKKSMGLLKGTLEGARVLYIEKEDKIAVGDMIWLKTSMLPSPIAVGKIKSVKKSDDSLFWDVEVALFSKDIFFDKLFVIK